MLKVFPEGDDNFSFQVYKAMLCCTITETWKQREDKVRSCMLLETEITFKGITNLQCYTICFKISSF